MINIRVLSMLREVKVLVTKYYRYPYIHKLNFADKETQLFKKSYFKSYYFRYSHVHSTGLLPWKNEEGLTCYPVTLYKGIVKFLPDKLFRQTLIVKDFYLLRMSDDYCFRRAAKGQRSSHNKKKTATASPVKSHNRPKGTKVFACGCSRRNLKKKFKKHVLGSFYCKVAACNSL